MGGITRIVGGEIKNTSTGMTFTTTDGDYELHAAQSIKLKGDEEGVEYADYKATHKDDVLSTGINVNLNIFFDGTQNNKTNTEARSVNSINHAAYEKTGNKNDDSFENDYTNIARGFDAVDPTAENQVAVYVEGIGTQNLKSDDIFSGVTTGEGETGIIAKVNKGCIDAAEQMFKKGYHQKEIDFLFVNVYGFSRGSAAARHFLHTANISADYAKLGAGKEKDTFKYQVNSFYYTNNNKYTLTVEAPNTAFLDKYGYFGACLLNQKMKIKKIIYNFVGLYDTVASFGVDHRGKKLFGKTVIESDTEQLKLNAISKARYVLHLASDDEYRDNFDLTNIKAAGLRGLELMFPGVHSDIGGSYLNEHNEISVVDNIECENNDDAKEKAKLKKEKDYDAFKKLVRTEGWYTDLQLKKEFFLEKDLDKFCKWYSGNAYQHNYGLVGRRKLFNTFDKIPLNIMIEASQQFDVKYLDYLLKDLEIKDSFIDQIKNDIAQYMNACVNCRNKYVDQYNSAITNFEGISQHYYDELKMYHYTSFMLPDDLIQLRNKYLHWSSKSNLIGYSPFKPGPLPQHERKRNIQDG